MPDYRMKLRRLESRIEVLERRNATLRAEVERLTLGQQPKWTPFQECTVGVFGDGRVIGHDGSYRVFLNSRYQVAVFDAPTSPMDCKCVHVSIKRVDGTAIHDWRDFQRIKNELVGPEAEGVELYPAESRLVDAANQFHLFVIDGKHWPMGFRERLVSEDNKDGVTQRLFDPDQRPSDLTTVTAQAMAKAAGLDA